MSGKTKTRTDNYPHLSLPFEMMKPEYDVVVIGSGYGAGVAASRMARAGKSVAVLELGWERRPGSFPHTLKECLADINISGDSTKTFDIWKWLPFPSSDPTRLFQFVMGDGQHAFLAHGLGGCSLINAGVFLEADEETLKMSPWPKEIRDEPSMLRKYYSRAASMLQPSTYPEDAPVLNKLRNLETQSIWLGGEQNFYRVPLTSFFTKTRNKAGVEMQANEGSGNESTGLNDGSKNSIPTTYLTDAWNWGVEIFCGCEVRFIEKALDGKGYIVHFALHGKGRQFFSEAFHNQLFWVKAKDLCFLGAGAIGTTEILLRSRDLGLQMSSSVGANLTSNGDLLLFGYNGDVDVNGVSKESPHGLKVPGPTVTGVIDNRKWVESLQNPLKGFIIQDGSVPESLSPIIQVMLMRQLYGGGIISSSLRESFRSKAGKMLSSLKSLIMGPYVQGGAIQRTATYLVMSHDSNELYLTMEGDKVRLRGPAEGRSVHLSGIREMVKMALTHAQARLGILYLYGHPHEEVTVHPLGGANMSRDGTGSEGVTNHIGQVFTGPGSEVYEGLLCCDGSIVPTALGVNPLATITAFAERTVEEIAKKGGLKIDMETENGNIDAASRPRVSNLRDNHPKEANKMKNSTCSIGWQFTEILDGHISMQSESVRFITAETTGKGSSCAIRAYLTIEICKKATGTHESRYTGKCTGTVSCYAFSKRTMRITNGEVRFFTRSEEHAELKAMEYSLHLLSVEGKTFILDGQKDIDSRLSFSFKTVWKATTTLNVRISQPGDTAVGSGILHISWPNFITQVKTFQSIERLNFIRILAFITFLVYFTHQIIVFFFRPFAPKSFPRKPQELATKWKKIEPSKSFEVTAADGVSTLLEMYEPSDTILEMGKGLDLPPVLFLPGVTGVDTEFNLYALPFVRCNMLDYFTRRGHSCYVLTQRGNWKWDVAGKCTVFDSRLDVAAALQSVNMREPRKPYVVAHCQGSVALAMGLLDGTIPRDHVLGVTANSVFMHQVFGYWNSVKGATTFLISLYELLAGTFFPVATERKEKNPFQRLLDVLLRFYPVQHRRDICTSTACHRTSFGFGLLWNHDNLNAALHENIHRFFAGTHTTLLKHVVRMGSRGQCLDNELTPLITPDNLSNLKDLPILFISGTDNEVFDPESTLRDYEILRHRFGEANYRRFLVKGYGHLDPIIGKRAAEDVYWRVYEHQKWCKENNQPSTEAALVNGNTRVDEYVECSL